MRRDRVEKESWVLTLHVNGDLSDAKSLLVILMGEVVTVVDEALSAEDVDVLAADEVLRIIELFLPEAHTRVMGHDSYLWNFALREKHWEWISA